jgi:hypothetical protein
MSNVFKLVTVAGFAIAIVILILMIAAAMGGFENSFSNPPV